jgi:hypothetical protein
MMLREEVHVEGEQPVTEAPETVEDDAAETPREAVIFVPGLAAEWGDHRLEDAADRIAAAFDRNAQTAEATFEVKLAGEKTYARDLKTSVCTIVRRDGAGSASVLDMYSFYYRSTLTERFEKRNLLSKALLVLGAILIAIPSLIRSLLPGRILGKSRRETFQVLQALGILFLLSAYMGFLVWALIQTVTSIPQFGGRNPSITGAQTITLLGAATGVAFPRIRTWISRAAVSYLSLIYYLMIGEQRQVIAGRFSSLLEYVSEMKRRYNRISIISYSFGTIVVLDSLFPRGREPGPRVELVKTLVTIGSPFDAIRTWWPKYFTDRHAHPSAPHRWINVYAPADVLGSDFRNSPNWRERRKQKRSNQPQGPQEPEEGLILAGGKPGPRPSENVVYSVNPSLEELSRVGVVSLMGLRAHAMYWDARPEAETVYGVVIPRMYARSRALR